MIHHLNGATVKRCGQRVRVHLAGRGYEVNCKSAPRARAFETWLTHWRGIAPDLDVGQLISRALFASLRGDAVERAAIFWQAAQPEWNERQVYERAQLDVECAVRFRRRRRR